MREFCVDFDRSKSFDWRPMLRVGARHDVLMNRVSRKVHDVRLLRLIGLYLRAGVMVEGILQPTDEGTPQGGPFARSFANNPGVALTAAIHAARLTKSRRDTKPKTHGKTMEKHAAEFDPQNNKTSDASGNTENSGENLVSSSRSVSIKRRRDQKEPLLSGTFSIPTSP